MDRAAQLRRRLWALALLTPVSGCDRSSPADGKPPQPSTAPKLGAEDAAVPKKKAIDKKVTKAPAPAPVKKPDPRFAPIPGDPPLVDGYNPEEERCPSGNWCADPDAVAVVALKNATNAEGYDNCPVRISGVRDPSKLKGKAFAGLSQSPAMIGSFNENRTRIRRAEGNEDMCCYHWFNYCSGRPLVEASAQRLPDVRAVAVAPQLGAELDDATRTAIAEGWIADARLEAASVPAFTRAAAELAAVAGPRELIDGCEAAAEDERVHAALCADLATAYGLRPTLGAIEAEPRDLDREAIAWAAFFEGCIAETAAALGADLAALRAGRARVREVLERIAIDEANHAALAWRIVRWGADASALGRMLTTLRTRLSEADTQGLESPLEAAPSALADAGRLTAEQQAWVLDCASRQVVLPMLEALHAEKQQVGGTRPVRQARSTSLQSGGSARVL